MTTAIRGTHRSATRRRDTRAAKSEPRLLVATDGERDSQGALKVTAALAARDDCPVMALGIAIPFPHKLSTIASMRPPVAIDEESRLDMLEHVQRSLRDIPGAKTWEKRAFVGIAVDAIQSVATQWGATLVVLGLRHHEGLKRLFAIQTLVPMARHTSVPILAVHRKATDLPRRAIAAIDFTPASIEAAVAAGGLLDQDGVLVVAHVCAFRESASSPGNLVDLYRAGARAKLDDAVRMLKRRTKAAVLGVMLEGEAVTSIVQYARENRCDLIAVGGHAMSLADRILLGSVRTNVIRRAPCSVLIGPALPANE